MNNKLCNSSWPDGVISRGLITCLAMVTSFMYWYDFWTALVVSANDDHIVDNALKTHNHDAPAFLAHFTPSLSLCFTLKSQFVVYSFTPASLAHFTLLSLTLLYPQKPICGVLFLHLFLPLTKSYCSGFSHYVPAFHVTFITHSSPSLFTSLTAIDSVWAVYILPEEVGSRIQALGMQYLTLQSSLSSKTMATLKIISPLDMEPIVTWEATKMRRTGNLNNMMFIEIGRRCEGGPGLIWMCTTPADTHNFRETLQRLVCGCE